jgi:hypothetical protein
MQFVHRLLKILSAPWVIKQMILMTRLLLCVCHWCHTVSRAYKANVTQYHTQCAVFVISMLVAG